MLALGVLTWHSVALLGKDLPWTTGPLNSLLHGEMMVDGFFALSGFLVGNSALRSKSVKTYAVNRVFRIFPGLFVCLCITAFVFAPFIAARTGVGLDISNSLSYVLRNMFVAPLQLPIGDTLGANPIPSQWNGSLWTLQYEVLAYIMVLVFAKTFRGNKTLLVAFTVAAGIADFVFSLLRDAHLISSVGKWFILVHGTRLAFMFTLGVVAATWSERIPLEGRLASIALVIWIASTYTVDYRTLGAAPFAYLLLYLGSKLKVPAFVQNNDLSFGAYIYAFPVQQMLIALGFNSTQPWLFILECVPVVLAFAALSWFLVERPASTWVKARVLKWLTA
jgi:peptidoglycan/LPS O-acetylase OafA/YrhL